MSFLAIPVRLNGQNVDAGWWNILRLAGLAIESYLGSFVGQLTAAIGNTQSGVNITGLLFSSASVRSAIIDYQIRRVSTGGSAAERVTTGSGIATYNTLATAWTYTPLSEGGDPSGVTLDINSSTGQMIYTSDTLPGSYDSAHSLITFTARTFA